MEKLKKVFSPGSNKDDEIMYGTPQPKDTHQKDKLDAQKGSETATDPVPSTLGDEGSKSMPYEQNVRPSEAPETVGSAQDSAPPSYDGTSSTLQPQGKVEDDAKSGLSIKSGKEGPYAGEPSANRATELHPGQDQLIGDTGGPESSHANVGQDAAIAGADAGATGLGAEALASDERQPEDDISNATYTNRSFPLSGGATDNVAKKAPSDPRGVGSSAPNVLGEDVAGHDPRTLGDNEPVMPSEKYPSTLRDTALAGAGAGAGMVAADKIAHEEQSHGSENLQSSAEPGHSYPVTGAPDSVESYHHDDEKPVKGTVRHVQGPHALDTANRLDPHIPGEFPDETGEDPHKHSHGAGGALTDATNVPASSKKSDEAADHHYGRDAAMVGGAGALGAAGYEASKDRSENFDPVVHPAADAPGKQVTPQDPQDPKDGHHYDRDAAMAGGAGALGVGGYEALKDQHEHVPPQQSDSLSHKTPSQPLESGATGVSQPPQVGSQESAAMEPPREPEEHHYGRDAAVAGGAGALGVGGYEALKNREPEQSDSLGRDTQATPLESGTTGTSQPFQADLQDPASMEPPREPDEHHYERNAALAGGAGAAGLGAYEYGKDRNDAAPVAEPTSSQVAPTVTGSQEPATMEPTREPEQHHHGRDAAIAGGAGAAGHGAYEYGKDRDEALPVSEPASSQAAPVTSTAGPKTSPLQEKAKDPKPYTAQQPSSSQAPAYTKEVPKYAEEAQPEEHHYGRDAAVAGGAGAAGYGGYEALKDHEKDAAAAGSTGVTGHGHYNELKDYYSKDVAKAVGADKEDQPEQQHHHGRDAAMAGGAGAAGYGAYETMKDRDDPARDVGAAQGQQSHPYVAQDPHGHHKLHKSPEQESKHEKKLEQAREQEAHRGEKKPSLLSKILHPHGKKHQHEEEPRDDTRIEPHTGLPMNVGKYGSTGAGGTDGAKQIEGYHEQDPALQHATKGTAHGADQGNYAHPGEEGVAGPDWEQIKKANTPY